MLSNTIRARFLEFFKNRGHVLLPSSPVFPHNDPSILFINAGMNQFKNIFLNKENTDYTRVSTSQKCIRAGGKHNDLENVGHTSRHLTFFEMLGNFSFGDYFKKEVISFAWEASLSVFNFDPEKIWATVHEKDDEAFSLWEKYLPTERIVRLQDKDNFWSMADTGPCGFCSELLFDRGNSFGSASSPEHDPEGERFLEYWNLVFMEFNRAKEGSLTPLPKKNIDTGAGLERLVSLLAGTSSVFETDVLRHIIEKIERLSNKNYSPSNQGAPFRVIADHVRSLSFAIADGLLPGNVDRGYVLRKILRRAVNYGKLIGFNNPFLGEIIPSLIEVMGDAYPELKEAENHICNVLTGEEENYLRTLNRGGTLFQKIIAHSQSKGIISGEDAFKLKDTYGLPLDEICLMAKDHNISVDVEAFSLLDQQSRDLSRKSAGKTKVDLSSSYELLDSDFSSTFCGYETTSSESFILCLLKDGKPVDSLTEGEQGEIILSQTPFYSEKGGQVGDQGEIFSSSGSFFVEDTQSPRANIIVHKGKMTTGSLSVREAITAQVNRGRRLKICANHSSCHLLHKALEVVLGSHVRQAGSYVDESKIRLDFTHHQALTKKDLRAIEDIVNEKIQENLEINVRESLYSDVIHCSEIKQFFGDKYGDVVRVVDMEFSKELCGGTHAKSTGCIGAFLIVKEQAVGTGIRRIEAISGEEALKFLRRKEDLLASLSKKLQTPEDSLEIKLDNLYKELSEAKETIKKLEDLFILQDIEHLKSSKIEEKISLIIHEIDSNYAHAIRTYADKLHHKTPSNLVSILTTSKGEKNTILIKISDNLVAEGFHANSLLHTILLPLGGKCGGKANCSQGSSPKQPQPEDIISTVQQWILTQSK
ncbi:alanine--tRNA ligase [Chlamydiifrater phoenicopteri]|uniref:alanine--tRNA ligase n=1 Tax=Chlamydiifrater phoenicopteri TaxID=2681469 RepID=UPI001BD0AA87|nr:alanine--tRNA ligase [Chlamydiifrater phoenicopteri]